MTKTQPPRLPNQTQCRLGPAALARGADHAPKPSGERDPRRRLSLLGRLPATLSRGGRSCHGRPSRGAERCRRPTAELFSLATAALWEAV